MGIALICGVCKTEVRVTAMTAAGTASSCDCGATTMTRLSKGELDLPKRGMSGSILDEQPEDVSMYVEPKDGRSE